MSNEEARKQFEEAMGDSVRKVSISEIPPEVAYALLVLGLDITSMYRLQYPNEPASEN